MTCVFALLTLSACNSVYIKPNTIDKDATFFAYRGGYGMERSIKETMEKRGYNVVVGRTSSKIKADDSTSEVVTIKKYTIPSNVRYVVDVEERKEFIRPIWCVFNGFWWWNFNVSVSDQKSGQEIMSWRGRGCANSSIRKLNKILDKMEGHE